MKGMIEAAGFVDVREQVVKMPWSPWALPHTEYHRIGQLLQKFIKTGMQGWLMAPLVKYKGVSGCERWLPTETDSRTVHGGAGQRAV